MQTRLNWTAILAIFTFAHVALAADASSLKPPAGAKVAVVVFEDLQCGDSARANPLVQQAASAHNIPIVLYEFPLPMHNWSFDAAVWAQFFQAKSEKLGSQFRDYIYANQTKITFANLQKFVRAFGDQNKISIPDASDPDGKLTERVKADFALGQRIGLIHTPTIFVVGQNGVSAPLVEAASRDELNQLIEDMLKKGGPEVPARRTPKKGIH